EQAKAMFRGGLLDRMAPMGKRFAGFFEPVVQAARLQEEEQASRLHHEAGRGQFDFPRAALGISRWPREKPWPERQPRRRHVSTSSLLSNPSAMIFTLWWAMPSQIARTSFWRDADRWMLRTSSMSSFT